MRHLVIGGSHGVGAGIVSALAKRGDLITSLSRTQPDNLSANHEWFKWDLRNDFTSARQFIEGSFGDRVYDSVVFNAALQDRKDTQWSTQAWSAHMYINCFSPFYLYEILWELGMVGTDHTLVYLGSEAGESGSAWAPAYAMSKAAMWILIQSKIKQIGADCKVTANRIFPGRVATPGNPYRKIPDDDPNKFKNVEEVLPHILNLIDQKFPTGMQLQTIDLGR